MTIHRFFAALIFMFSFSAFAGQAPQPAATVAPPAPEVDESIMDKTTNPCDNFYQYACGGWLAKTKIPADHARWSRGFSTVEERNKLVLDDLLKSYEAGKKSPDVPYTDKLGSFYAACMDEAAVEKNAMPSLEGELKKIDGLKDLSSLGALLGELHLDSINSLFSDGPEVDLKDPNKMIYSVDQGGLGLPDREYYLSQDSKMKKIRRQYVAHIEKILTMINVPAAKAKAEAKMILNLETRLAKVSMDRVLRRDPRATYHRLELKGLKEKAPDLDWAAFLKSMGYPKITEIDVKVPDFFSGLDAVLTKTPLENLKTYLKFHFVDDSSPGLAKRFVDERFHFYGRQLSGQKKLEARWKRCVAAEDQFLGFALGHAFVDVDFGKSGKKISKGMVQTIEDALRKNLEDITWMDDKTKKEAFKKLDKVVNKIGYPDKWRNYDSFKVSRDDYFMDRLEGSRFLTRFYMDKIGKPVDKNEWEMSPPTVNAYYDPQYNEMVFPAGILQPPFFSKTFSQAVNYGGIGMVMGHELTHGYDDEGRLYNAEGALADWWSAASAKEFKKRADCLAAQYDKYTLQKTLHVNGKLTLGENIADQGGIKLAYNAWKSQQPKSKDDGKTASGFTGAQKFFLAYAQSWCEKSQPEMQRMLLTIDVHSPGIWRVNGAVSNSEPFAQAFQCKAGSPMAPKDRCAVW